MTMLICTNPALLYRLKRVWSFVHNIFMMGAPGSGKTLLARAIPDILPEMRIDESLDVTRIYSVADQLPAGTPLIRHRPFRAPHYTISHTGLAGGDKIPKPGEISLDRGDESLSLWLLWRSAKTLYMCCRGSNQKSETDPGPILAINSLNRAINDSSTLESFLRF